MKAIDFLIDEDLPEDKEINFKENLYLLNKKSMKLKQLAESRVSNKNSKMPDNKQHINLDRSVFTVKY